MKKMKNILILLIIATTNFFVVQSQEIDIDSIPTISMYKVEQLPLPQTCNDVSDEEKTTCLLNYINEHLKNNLQIPPNEDFKTFDRKNIVVSFVITNDGLISNIKVESSENTKFKELFEKEIIRVLKSLPNFKPGIHNELPVNVFFKNIISCTLIKRKDKNTNQDTILPYVSVYNIVTEPNFPICIKISDDTEILKDCFNEQLDHHIKKNFNYPEEAAKNNIRGKVSVSFIIDKEGNITNLKSRGPENGELLIDEAERIIKKIPKLVPGTINRKPVEVSYAIPIIFN